MPARPMTDRIPAPVTNRPVADGPVAAGFFGKLPCRGDFLRAGLPAGFVSAWDAWVSAGIARSRDGVGEDGWTAAWMEAPVWRFLLPPGKCGPDAVLGLWMPSVDAAGRCFPLAAAAVFAGGGPGVCDESWLDEAEEHGRTALEFDRPPAALGAALAGLPAPRGEAGGPVGRWWTAGAPRVPPVSLVADALPAPDRFAAMIGLPG